MAMVGIIRTGRGTGKLVWGICFYCAVQNASGRCSTSPCRSQWRASVQAGYDLFQGGDREREEVIASLGRGRTLIRQLEDAMARLRYCDVTT